MAPFLGLIFALGLLIFTIYCNCRISRRLGYDGLTGLLLAVPILNFIIWGVWAFNESPNERKIRVLHGQLSSNRTPEVAEALQAMAGEQEP